MSTWNEDRKYVLEMLKQNEGDHKELLMKIDKLGEGQWKLHARVAGIASVMGLLGGALIKMAIG